MDNLWRYKYDELTREAALEEPAAYYERKANSKLYTVCHSESGSTYWLNFQDSTFQKKNNRNKEEPIYKASIITAIRDFEIFEQGTLKKIHHFTSQLTSSEQYDRLRVGNTLYLYNETEYYLSSMIVKIQFVEIDEKGTEIVVAESSTMASSPKVIWNLIQTMPYHMKAFNIGW